jgi:hypothetical protein
MRSLHQRGPRGVASQRGYRQSECWRLVTDQDRNGTSTVPNYRCEASVVNLPPADFTAQLTSWCRQIIQIPCHLNDGTDSTRNGRGIRLPHAELKQILHKEGSACSALSRLGTKVCRALNTRDGWSEPTCLREREALQSDLKPGEIP